MVKETTRHSDYFEKMMSDERIARAFFKSYLPDAIKKQLDFSNIQFVPLKTSFVSDNPTEHRIADFLFQVQSPNGATDLLIHVEHQSTADKFMALRMMNYSSHILLDHADLHSKLKKLPPVIGLVYYHGKSAPYPYSLDIDDLFKTEKKFQSFLFKPILIDLSQYDDVELKSHEEMAPIDLILKYIFRDDKNEKFNEILSLLAHCKRKIQYICIQYLYDKIGIPRKEFVEMALKYIDREVIMTIADQFRQEGRQEGRHEGRREGFRKGQKCGSQKEKYQIAKKLFELNVEFKNINAATGLTCSELMKIQQQVDLQKSINQKEKH